MRLLLLTPDFPPARGGVQSLLDHLASGLSLRHRVRVVTVSQGSARVWDRTRPYRIVRVPSARVRVIGLALLAARTLLEVIRFRPDVILCGHVLLGPICDAVHRIFRIRYLAFAYGSEVRSARMQHVAGLTLRGATRVVTISEFTSQAILAHGVAAERIAVLRPGPGIDAPATADERPERGEAPILLSVSRLAERYKGHDMVIRALPLIRAKLPDARYVIVGDGWLRSYLERIATSVGVRDAVLFTGELSNEEVEAWYRRSDVFVGVSRESAVGGGAEGYGMVFIEANLRGKPVIAGRSGGIPDAVIDGVTGLLVDPRRVDEIADAAVRLLSDRGLAARLGAQGRARAISEVSWVRYLREFESLLVSLS
jgi:phosphatidylinositol alpha-1,6-mannosyltransferase